MTKEPGPYALAAEARLQGHSGKYPMRLRAARSRGRRWPGADHQSPAHPGRRAHRGAGLQGHRAAAAALWGDQRHGPDPSSWSPTPSRRQATPKGCSSSRTGRCSTSFTGRSWTRSRCTSALPIPLTLLRKAAPPMTKGFYPRLCRLQLREKRKILLSLPADGPFHGGGVLYQRWPWRTRRICPIRPDTAI